MQNWWIVFLLAPRPRLIGGGKYVFFACVCVLACLGAHMHVYVRAVCEWVELPPPLSLSSTSRSLPWWVDEVCIIGNVVTIRLRARQGGGGEAWP